MEGNGTAKPPLAEGDKMADNSPEKPTLPHDPAQSHLTLISVMFGVALGFWVSTVNNHENWSLPLVISILLTLAVIVCIYWWYTHLCTLYPSRTLIHYSIDFGIVIGLCILSSSCGDDTQFLWTVAWGLLAAFASLKLWFGVGPIFHHPCRTLVWPPRIAAPIILLLALYSAMLAYDYYQSGSSLPILHRICIWIPVAGGIIVTFVVSHIYSKGYRESGKG